MGSRLDRIKDWKALFTRAHFRADQLPHVADSSSRNLRRFFKRRFGRPPQDLLDEERGEAAKTMLLNGDDEKTIIDRLGFKSMPHFSTWFKRRFRKAPREFRDAAIRMSVRKGARVNYDRDERSRRFFSAAWILAATDKFWPL